MRALIAVGLALMLVGALASCGGGYPRSVPVAPGVTTPASPLASPAGSYVPGY